MESISFIHIPPGDLEKEERAKEPAQKENDGYLLREGKLE